MTIRGTGIALAAVDLALALTGFTRLPLIGAAACLADALLLDDDALAVAGTALLAVAGDFLVVDRREPALAAAAMVFTAGLPVAVFRVAARFVFVVSGLDFGLAALTPDDLFNGAFLPVVLDFVDVDLATLPSAPWQAPHHAGNRPKTAVIQPLEGRKRIPGKTPLCQAERGRIFRNLLNRPESRSARCHPTTDK
jgi:hypothetical protein